jgi:hypothetical protein
VDGVGDALTAVADMAVLADGTLFSLHPMEKVVRSFTPQGTLRSMIGGAGDGPGEFRNPTHIGVDGDTTLWVADANGTVSFFSLTGEHQSSIHVPPEHQGSRLYPLAISENRGIIAIPILSSRAIAVGEISEQEYQLAADGEVVRTLVSVPIANSQLAIRTSQNPNAGGIYDRQPYDDSHLVKFSTLASNLVLVDRRVREQDPHYTITKVSLGGDTLSSRSYRYSPEPIPSAMVNHIRRAWLEYLGSPRRVYERLLEANLYLPPHHPPVTDVVLGRDGTIWLQKGTSAQLPHWISPLESSAGPQIWNVLDEGGDPVGTVSLPQGVTVLAADRRHIWGTVLGELDEPYIVRFRLAQP